MISTRWRSPTSSVSIEFVGIDVEPVGLADLAEMRLRLVEVDATARQCGLGAEDDALENGQVAPPA